MTNRLYALMSLLPLFLLLAVGCGGNGGETPQDLSAADETAADVPSVPDSEVPDVEADTAPVSGLSRLGVDGTRIVDEEGNEVRLRGVNLGGWMFHETWITLVGYASHGRVLQLAQEQGIEAEAIEAMQEIGISYGSDPAVLKVCPANGDGWLAGLQEPLAARIGDEQAAAFVAEVEKYPPLCDDSEKKLRDLLAERFGPDGRDELLDGFQEGWLTESDIEWLAGQGFTVVRVPIGYRSLMTGTDSDLPEALNWNEAALEKLDRLLDWCGKHGLYAVIDIQEAPGGQNTYAAEAGLYGNPKMEALTVELWEVLSDRFKDRDEVAAYSLLAEPYGAPDTKARDEMYDKLVKAIRARGDDHLLVIHDGFFGMGTLPVPSEYGWEGVIYSTHLFEWTLKDLSGYDLILSVYEDTFGKAQAKQNVPYYIGSFSTFRDEEWCYEAAEKMATWMEEKGWSWSLWTFKRIDDPATKTVFGFETAWGLLGRLDGAFERPDPHRDDFDTLKNRLTAYAGISLLPNQKLLDALLSSFAR